MSGIIYKSKIATLFKNFKKVKKVQALALFKKAEIHLKEEDFQPCKKDFWTSSNKIYALVHITFNEFATMTN